MDVFVCLKIRLNRIVPSLQFLGKADKKQMQTMPFWVFIADLSGLRRRV
jgi:hypothetical protein